MSTDKMTAEMRKVFAAWGAEGGRKAAKRMTKAERQERSAKGAAMREANRRKKARKAT